MPLDADIAAAGNVLSVEKIKAQEYRNSVADLKAFRAAQGARLDAFILWARTEYAALPPAVQTPAEARESARISLTKLLSEKYMTTSTATVPETILKDAREDSARLKAGVDAILDLLFPPS